MKKLLTLVSVLALVFTSCSSNDSSSENNQLNTEGVLVKRVINYFGTNKTINDFHYINGNKLQSITSSGTDNSNTFYEYSNDLIIEKNVYNNNILQYKEKYEYDSNERMVGKQEYDYVRDEGYRSEYTYNLDGTVDVIGFKGSLTSQNTQIINNKVYLFPNGDVEKIEKFKQINGVNHIQTRVYTYDDKNNVFNSILNFNKIKDWDVGTSGNLRNNISILYTTTENVQPYTREINFTYNSMDFPITESWSSLYSEFFYQ